MSLLLAATPTLLLVPQRGMKPEQMNKISPEELDERVDQIVLPEDSGAVDTPPLAPFLTLEVLLRVHERIVELINKQIGRLTKHKALARAVCVLTGVPVPPDDRDVEKVGNHVDIWLKRNYIDVERKLLRNIRNKENLDRQRAELRQRCCVVSAMGRLVEFYGPFDEVEGCSTHAARKRDPIYVPYTHSLLPPAMSMLELKEAASNAQRQVASAEADCKRERQRHDCQRLRAEAVKSSCKRARVQAASARKAARTTKYEMLEMERQAAKRLKDFARQAHAEKLRSDREAADVLRQEQAKVLRLGIKVAAANQEANLIALNQLQLQQKADSNRARAEAELRGLEAQLSTQQAERVRFERETSQALHDARAKVLRLSSQVAAATQEAANHARKEANAILELQKQRARAELEAESRQQEALAQRAQRRKDARESERKLTDAKAQLLRLGSQVAAATQEASNHTREKELLRIAKEEKEREVQECKDEQAYLLQKLQCEASARKECARQRDAANLMRDAVKETSKKRLHAKKELSERLTILSAECDELHLELDDMRNESDQNKGAAAKMASMPTWRHERVKGRRGGGMQLQFQHRLAILEQHANGTPPSAIGNNIVSVVKKVAPWLQPVCPSHREVQQIGFELPTMEEALAARRTAAAFRVRLLGFDETTDLQVPVLTSNVQVQDDEHSPVQDVVLKAAYLSTKGGTSEAVTSEIEDKCFARLRDLLRLWKKHHDRLFPDNVWTGPDVDNCSLHRLAAGGALMSDTCNAARKTKKLLTGLIQKQAESAFRETYGDEAWESKPDDARTEMLRVYSLDCQHHLRNIWMGHMSVKQAQHVQQELSSQLQHFAAWERMSTDYEQLLRAVYKEFHQGGRYYKGKGRDFASWLLEKYPDVFFMHIERADGGRQVCGLPRCPLPSCPQPCTHCCPLHRAHNQDLDYDAAIPIYVNRPYLVEYLHSHVFSANHSNILEDFLYQALITTQFIAMSRANALIDLRISRPHRWLAGKTPELAHNWSPIRMNWVLDLIDEAFQTIRDDGSALLNPDWEIFAPVAEMQPLFNEYLDFTYNHDVVLSPSGRVRHLHYKLALAELLDPSDETNRATREKTIEYLQVQAKAALEKMYDPKLAIADKLTSQDGQNSFGKLGKVDEDLRGCNATNDATAEAVFGAWKLERRRNPGISVRRSSGLAQARVSKCLALPESVRRRKARLDPTAKLLRRRQSSSMFGYFHRLPHTEQVALVDMCRVERKQQRILDRNDWDELHTLRSDTRKSNSQLELESLIKHFALALSFFDRYKQRGVHSVAQMESHLQSMQSTQLSLDWIREQIEMRVVGLGWVEFKKNWSSGANESVGTVADLKSHLAEILEEEEERQIPEAAPAPIMQRKTFKELGLKTCQAELLSNQRLSHSWEQLRAAAVLERQRLEESGVLDIVGDRQPERPPPLDETLVGRKLEIHWRYWRPAQPGERGTKKQARFIRPSRAHCTAARAI